jgi:hypothetical protein
MNLSEALRQSHRRALTVTLAHDLHPDYVRLLVESAPWAAADVLAMIRPGPYWREEERVRSLTENLPAFWAAAPDATLAAVHGVISPGERAELFIKLLDKPGAYSAKLLALARESAATEPKGYPRARALLALAAVTGEPDLVAEAYGITTRDWQAGRLVRDFGAPWEVRERLRRVEDADLRLELARHERPEKALELVDQAINLRWNDHNRQMVQYYVTNAAEIVPIERLRPWVDRCLSVLDRWHSVDHAINAWAPHADTDQLDTMVRAVHTDRWDAAMLLADLSRHHPARRDELLAKARTAMARELDPVNEVRKYVTFSEAVDGEERLRSQRTALEVLAEVGEGYDELEDLSRLNWTHLGRAIDPSLREDLVEVLLGFEYRYSCWAGIGGVLAEFPVELRGTGLRALDRVSDEFELPDFDVAVASRSESVRSESVRKGRSHGQVPGSRNFGGGLVRSAKEVVRGEGEVVSEEEEVDREEVEVDHGKVRSDLEALATDLGAPVTDLEALATELEALVAELAADGYLSYGLDLRDRLAAVDVPDLLVKVLDAHHGDMETFPRLVWELAPALVRAGGPGVLDALRGNELAVPMQLRTAMEIQQAVDGHSW